MKRRPLPLQLPGARGWDYTTFAVPWLRLHDPEDGLNLRMALSGGGCFPKEKEGARRSVPLSRPEPERLEVRRRPHT